MVKKVLWKMISRNQIMSTAVPNIHQRLVSSICKKYYVIRFSTLFGDRSNKLLGFVDKVIKQLKNNKTLKIASDKVDTPTYAKDAATELLKILLKKLMAHTICK